MMTRKHKGLKTMLQLSVASAAIAISGCSTTSLTSSASQADHLSGMDSLISAQDTSVKRKHRHSYLYYRHGRGHGYGPRRGY